MVSWLWLIVEGIVLGGAFFVWFLSETGKTDGELQLYETEDGLYPVLALNSKDSTNKLIVRLSVKKISSRQ